MDVIVLHTTQRELPHTTQRELQVMYDIIIWTMEHVYRTCSTDKLYNKDGSSYLTGCGEDVCGPVEIVYRKFYISFTHSVGQFYT